MIVRLNVSIGRTTSVAGNTTMVSMRLWWSRNSLVRARNIGGSLIAMGNCTVEFAAIDVPATRTNVIDIAPSLAAITAPIVALTIELLVVNAVPQHRSISGFWRPY